MSVLSFLLLLTPLALVFTAFIIWPLLARRGGDSRADGNDASGRTATIETDHPVDRQAAANRAVVAERRAQLDDEIRDLPADSPERARRIAEFTRTALADLAPAAAAPVRRRTRHTGLVVSLLVILLALPLIGYRLAGTPEWPGIVERSQTEERDVRGLVAEVEKRLAANPADAQGWLLLGRTRIALGEPASGIVALERALAVDSREPALAAQIRADLADALARSEGVDIAGRPATLIREALAQVPNHPKSLALAGAFAAAAGEPARARTFWQQLLVELPAGSEQARQVEGLLAQLPNDSATAAAAPDGDAATTGPRLTGRIDLDPGLAASVSPDDTVFVVARGLDAQDEVTGPPLAVVRLRVADLPYDFALDDRAAMTPSATLSKQPRVRVVGRVSRSGSARPASGDLEGSSPPVAHDATGVAVRLDRRVP